MKFNKNICCEECSLKCDIHEVLCLNKVDFKDVKPIHVYYKKHEIICKQGSDTSHAIYLVRGSAKLYIEGINGRNICLYLLTPHSYIGLLSFFETPKYSYSVMALEETEICMIDINYIKNLYLKNHDFLIKLNKAFGKSVASIMQKIITLNQKNIRGRVADSLLYLAKLNNNMCFNMLLTRKELGELSAISEENTVRLLTEFKNERIIDVEGRNITIIDEKLLKKISELG